MANKDEKMKTRNASANARKGFGLVLQIVGLAGVILSTVSKKTVPDESLTYFLYVFLGFSFVIQAKDMEQIQLMKKSLESDQINKNE